MEDIWKSLREMEWDDIVPEKDVIQRPSIPGPYAGQKHTEEVKQLMRIPKTEEHKEKIRQAVKKNWDTKRTRTTKKGPLSGIRWWTDGNTNTRSFTCPGDGWRIGKTTNQIPPPTKGMKWWNNGQINKVSVECPGIEWCRGML